MSSILIYTVNHKYLCYNIKVNNMVFKQNQHMKKLDFVCCQWVCRSTLYSYRRYPFMKIFGCMLSFPKSVLYEE